jgi:hypothetical protein
MKLTRDLRFVAMYDIHYGKERLSTRHYRNTHSMKAITPIFKFMDDFKPNAFVFGGDQNDFGEISHWTKHQRLSNEGLRLIDSLHGFKRDVLDEVDSRLPKGAEKIYILGNHERFLLDLLDENPALEGILDIDRELDLTARGWKIIQMRDSAHLGKLHFIHGQQIAGGEHVAKNAVTSYERSIRFGHAHTYQVYCKTSALDANDFKTGVCVPCLCIRDMKYGEGKPNRWANGFLWGYVAKNGSFNDYVSIIVNGRFMANGRHYR